MIEPLRQLPKSVAEGYSPPAVNPGHPITDDQVGDAIDEMTKNLPFGMKPSALPELAGKTIVQIASGQITRFAKSP